MIPFLFHICWFTTTLSFLLAFTYVSYFQSQQWQKEHQKAHGFLLCHEDKQQPPTIPDYLPQNAKTYDDEHWYDHSQQKSIKRLVGTMFPNWFFGQLWHFIDVFQLFLIILNYGMRNLMFMLLLVKEHLSTIGLFSLDEEVDVAAHRKDCWQHETEHFGKSSQLLWPVQW